MCGINVIIDKSGYLPETIIQRMTAATYHRGPDTTTFHRSTAGKNQLYFGHNRLKIIDLSDAANQPFFSPDGRYLLLYNGEIYNYKALKAALQLRGCLFKTESDTEVILHLLVLEGQDGLARLNGMFVLVFYDTQEQRLLVARDRFGIKPLFYSETADYLILSSEIKAILQAGLIPKKINQNQIYHYLRFKYAAKPQTFFEGILELPEGTALHWKKGQVRLSSYYTNGKTEDSPANGQKVTQHVENLLTESVEKHLIADVPVGLFLSGGIDSTLLLALLHKTGHRHFPTFSITHPATAGSFGTADTRFAVLAAHQYAAEHTCFEIDESILTGTDTWVQALDQPIADGAGLLTSYLSRQVKPYIKVALSGAGADELFGGYNRHRAFFVVQQNQRLASAFRRVLPAFMPLLPTGFDHPMRKQFLLLRKLAAKIKQDPCETFLNFTAMDSALAELWQLEKVPANAYKNSGIPQDLLRWMLQHDQHHYLISDILAVTDQAGMQHSLEIRTPYLENNLSTYLNGLESKVLLNGRQKWVLKAILKAQNGEAFIRRSKEGFGMPLGNWLRKPQNYYLLKELHNPQHLVFAYLNFSQTQKLLQRHQRQRQDYSTEIWALLILAKWLQHNFG